MKNLTELNRKELTSVNGGTFAWDVGWLLGNALAGAGTSIIATQKALLKYHLHYAQE